MKKTTFIHSIPWIAAGAILFLAPFAGHAQGPDPTKPFIQSISYGGSGCPQGTVGQSIANNRLTFTLIFDSFVASSGPAVPATEARKNCQVKLTLSVPKGLSIWAQTTSARGYIQMPAGQKASVRSSAELSRPNGHDDDDDPEDGSGVAGRTSVTNFKGPVTKDYLIVDGHAWSVNAKCDGPATSTRTLTLEYTTEAGKSPAATQLSLDSLDGAISVQKVKACNGKKDDDN